MEVKKIDFSYEEYDSINELPESDRQLLLKAKEATTLAYVPYSHFRVGAAALLANGKVLCGANQENASYPVTVCAERTLLGTVSSIYPHVEIEAIAISYINQNGTGDKPVSPCGLCRQTIVEYENRLKKKIRLILGGESGKVYVVPQATSLLPLSFTAEDMAAVHKIK